MLFVRDSPRTLPEAGGYLRSMQVAEIVTASGHSLVDFAEFDLIPKTLAERNGRRRVIRHLKRSPDYGDSGNRFRNKRTAMRYLLTNDLFDTLPRVDAFIWERTQRHGGLLAARERGIRTIAVAHNIESLVPSEQLMYALDGPHERFAAECSQLRLADHRVVISRRDQWLLALFGVDSMVLPYYPPRARLERLRRVRIRRRPAHNTTRLLVMGAARYAPTYEGMRHILQILKASRAMQHRVCVDVIGFDTESLAAECAAENIVFHGAVSDTFMFERMATASAALVYQKSATGALTRIPEFLIAGLPVLSNPTAARSYEHRDGVHLFDDEDSLLSLAESLDFSALPPEVPFPEQATRRFIDCLEN